MADLKTQLRELSVAASLGLLIRSIPFKVEDLYSPDRFYAYVEKVVTGPLPSSWAGKGEPLFPAPCIQIIENGYNLARYLFEHPHFHFTPGDEITWQGNDNHKDDPVDITVGAYKFSLKEQSFILENMGLYKLVNCYTGSQYKKRHIFKDYAPAEYSRWFQTSWEEMIRLLEQRGGRWEFTSPQGDKRVSLERAGERVALRLQRLGRTTQVWLPLHCTLEEYEKGTTARLREDVFARFIYQNLRENQNYLRTKREAALVAAQGLARELKENLHYGSLARFLRIHPFAYYYAKTTEEGIQVYRVPALQEFSKEIEIQSITASVPDTQANILTTIRNRSSGRQLQLRNECRFSHGQFNGTPEAKMYYQQGGSLLTIYQPI